MIEKQHLSPHFRIGNNIMLKPYHLLIVMAFFLTACMHPAPHVCVKPHQPKKSVAVPVQPHSMKQHRPVKPFTQIKANGRINLNLHTGYRHPEVMLRGDPRDLAQVSVRNCGTNLCINIHKDYPRFGQITADIKQQHLNGLFYKGAGVIKGTHLHTQYLELAIENQGTTELGGTIGLQKLDIVGNGLTQISGVTSHDVEIHMVGTPKGSPKLQMTGSASLSNIDINGNGTLSFYWVTSNHLAIKATQGAKIQLAGIVNRLEVDLWGNARFKGRYLRAQRSFVKTHDHSIAEISSVYHQSSLATDASDIYYYNIPSTRADFMAYNGSVLNMREWSVFDTQNYNRYNKQFP